MKSSLGQYCINVTDLERSIRFYDEGLGLDVQSRTNDFKGLYEKALAAGAKSAMEPTPLDKWPVTIAYIEDPDGYTIELVEYNQP